MAYEEFDNNDPEALNRMRTMFNPQQVDQQIRQAIQFCWLMLPPEKKTVQEVEKEIRRIVDRALRDLREDAQGFGLGKA
jgi:BMFP domain-containing protein YqiC